MARHLVDQRAGDLGVCGARGQQVDAVAHFGDLGEHDSRAGAEPQVGGASDIATHQYFRSRPLAASRRKNFSADEEGDARKTRRWRQPE
jgi:hypothetical protein